MLSASWVPWMLRNVTCLKLNACKRLNLPNDPNARDVNVYGASDVSGEWVPWMLKLVVCSGCFGCEGYMGALDVCPRWVPLMLKLNGGCLGCLRCMGAWCCVL